MFYLGMLLSLRGSFLGQLLLAARAKETFKFFMTTTLPNPHYSLGAPGFCCGKVSREPKMLNPRALNGLMEDMCKMHFLQLIECIFSQTCLNHCK